MSQRDSGYVRQERDLYETPAWVTYALLPHLPRKPRLVWECASGPGKMAAALNESDLLVQASDISRGTDFLLCTSNYGLDTIITNPPFNLATEFIERALALVQPNAGMVAMLLNSDFDHASTRKHLFAECAAFCKTVVLTKRIKWFEGPVKCKHCKGVGLHFINPAGLMKCKPCGGKGSKEQSPSENHSWFIWDWKHSGPSTKAYGP